MFFKKVPVKEALPCLGIRPTCGAVLPGQVMFQARAACRRQGPAGMLDSNIWLAVV